MTAPVAAVAAKRAKSGAARVPLTGTFGDEDTFGAPTAADNAAFKRSARAREKDDAAAYGGDPSPRANRRPSTGDGKPHAFRPANLARGRSPVPGGNVAEEGAGFLLGLFAYALLVNFLRAGPAGVRAWLAAKFINKTSTPATAPTNPSMSPTTLRYTPESALHGGSTT